MKPNSIRNTRRGIFSLVIIACSFASTSEAQSFGPAQTIVAPQPTSFNPYALHLSDIDDDGYDDVFMIKSGVEITLYENRLNTPNLDFNPTPTVITPNTPWTSYSDFDINLDGTTDHLLRLGFDQGAGWYSNLSTDGNFSLTGPNAIPFDELPSYINSSDIDKDGDEDIVFTYEGMTTQGAKWLENVSTANNPSFNAPQLIHDEFDGSSSNVYSVDLTSDGFPEIIGYSINTPQSLLWVESNDTGTSITFDANEIVLGDIFAEAISFGDIDADGDQDIVCMGYGTTSPMSGSMVIEGIYYFENQLNEVANDFVGPISLIDSEIYASGFDTVALIDFDGDSDEDIICGIYDPNTPMNPNHLRLYENISTGSTLTFDSPENLYGPNNAIQTLNLADLNNDGASDIIISLEGDGSAYWFENLENSSVEQEFWLFD